MGTSDPVKDDASSTEPAELSRKPYLTFQPQFQTVHPVVVQAVQVRSRTRYIGGIILAVAATVAMVHGIYFTYDDHPVEFPIINQVSIGIAIFAYIGAYMTIRGRHYFLAIAGPLTLILVMVWDFGMQFLCLCSHEPIAGFILIPLIGLSGRFIFQSRSEFLD